MRRKLAALLSGLVLLCTTTTVFLPNGRVMFCTTCCWSYGSCTQSCYQ